MGVISIANPSGLHHSPESPAKRQTDAGEDTGTQPDDEATVLAGLDLDLIPDGPYVTGDESRAALARISARIAELEAKLKRYESAAILTNDHQTRAFRMGQEQGRADLAEEVASVLTTAPDRVPQFLRRFIDGEN